MPTRTKAHLLKQRDRAISMIKSVLGAEFTETIVENKSKIRISCEIEIQEKRLLRFLQAYVTIGHMFEIPLRAGFVTDFLTKGVKIPYGMALFNADDPIELYELDRYNALPARFFEENGFQFKKCRTLHVGSNRQGYSRVIEFILAQIDKAIEKKSSEIVADEILSRLSEEEFKALERRFRERFEEQFVEEDIDIPIPEGMEKIFPESRNE